MHTPRAFIPALAGVLVGALATYAYVWTAISSLPESAWRSC